MDATTRASYEAALKKAEAELTAHEERGTALRSTVEALKNLLALQPAAPAAPKKRAVRKRKKQVRRRRTVGTSDHPPVPADFFKGMGPTPAYRKFVEEFGADFPVPTIRDTLLAGGVKTTSPTSLLTGLHSIRRRDAMKEKVEGQAETAKEDGGDES